jgi:Ser/Thr protein kinase RdoA (MazF antagonist)
MLEGRVLRALPPFVMLGVVRYAQDVLDDGQEQNGAADRIESPTKPRSLRRIAAETKNLGVNDIGIQDPSIS